MRLASRLLRDRVVREWRGPAPAGKAASNPQLKEIMTKIGKGPQALQGSLGEALKQAPPAWDVIQGKTKEYALLTAESGQARPGQGDQGLMVQTDQDLFRVGRRARTRRHRAKTRRKRRSRLMLWAIRAWAVTANTGSWVRRWRHGAWRNGSWRSRWHGNAARRWIPSARWRRRTGRATTALRQTRWRVQVQLIRLSLEGRNRDPSTVRPDGSDQPVANRWTRGWTLVSREYPQWNSP